jgi:hypothetical protein
MFRYTIYKTNTMKRSLLLMLVFATSLLSAQKTAVIHDDHAQLRPVTNFTSIKVSSAIDLYLTQSSSNTVAVSAKDVESRDRIITEVSGGTLIIRMADQEGWWSWKRWSDVKAKAYVSVKDLEAITGSGATNIHLVNKIQSPKLKIKLSGASDLKGDIDGGVIAINLTGASECKGQIVAKSISIDCSGASTTELSGTSDDLSVEVSGASDAKLYSLNVKGAVVHASGASNANVTVSQLLKAEASGASNINYKGDPTVRENNSSGASNIRHRD